MKSKVYLETSFISYLAAKPNRDLIIAAHQQVTHEWWENRRTHFELYISQLVLNEAEKGDREAAKRRMIYLQELPILELNTDIKNLVNALINNNVIPKEYVEDAYHIALSTIHGMDFLLTWNCKHIANASVRNKIEDICRFYKYICPTICTPEELLGE